MPVSYGLLIFIDIVPCYSEYVMNEGRVGVEL
jgi:hypothetical protein